MRNLYDLKKIHRSLLLLLVFGLLFQACRNVEELSEDLVIYVDTDVVLNPLTLQITGAEPGENLPDNIQVRVLGEDKDRVYSVLGERGLTVEVAQHLLGRGYQLRIYDPQLNLAQLIGANRRVIDEKMPHLAAESADQHTGAVERETDHVDDRVRLQIAD